jgi:hypothetical protein
LLKTAERLAIQPHGQLHTLSGVIAMGDPAMTIKPGESFAIAGVKMDNAFRRGVEMPGYGAE